jgi:hypothetical protein
VAKPIIRKIRLRTNRAAPIKTMPLRLAAPSKPARKAAAGLRFSDPKFWTVIGDLPAPTPVSRTGLYAIEKHFAGFLVVVFDRPRNSWP